VEYLAKSTRTKLLCKLERLSYLDIHNYKYNINSKEKYSRNGNIP
jgi:hypothetical protein